MVDIDERVVSMKFDSNDFEQKSKSTLSILDKLSNALSFKNAADGSEDALNSITDNVQKMADKAYTIVDRMIDKIKDNIANKLVNFLQQNTIGQLQAGWSKYADMTTSVATLKGQGYAMEDITDQLERLNYFTDETSYNFTAMVSEIGKFTASGQSLEDATTAMMGIAEWAALSGKNASEASRAMYQLSQALGAGEMRLQDYKSIQNLNMDTIEFRKNAIEAAIAAGTLKDNLNGTYTSLINNKVTFSLQNFAESLTKGKWFNSQVMMTTYKKYSEAVDEIRSIYEEGSYRDAEGNYTELNTTAEAVRLVKENNRKLVESFEETELGADDISKLLSKWKKVENVTGKTVKEYAELHEISEEQAKLQMEEAQKGYAEYLKEYAETFKDAEVSAEEALSKWQTYVSEYGVKAFLSAQEAKTFGEAIESAKDAASTVWTTIYTNVFGNYDEAKQLWTDLANSLYDIFVTRLWDLNDVFEYWRTGGSSALKNMLDKYKKELASLKTKTSPTTLEIDRMRDLEKEIKRLDTEIHTVFLNGEKTTTYAVEKEIKKYKNQLNEITKKTNLTEADKERIKALKKELGTLNEALDNTIFVDGRRRALQGIYAFGAGFKSLLENLRKGWDQVTEDNIGGKKLLSFSEKLRVDGFRFYNMMQDLGKGSFFINISQGIKNLLSPITGLIRIVGSAIGQFLPSSKTLRDTLNDLSSRFKDFTEKIRPSEETLQRLARILRGIISFFRLLGKAALGIWNSIIKPIFDILFDGANGILTNILELIAQIGDAFFNWEKGVDEMTAMATVGAVLKNIIGAVYTVIKNLVLLLLRGLAPIIKVIYNTVKSVIDKISGLVGGKGGNLLTNIANGFKNIGDRAKTAWKSGESLADVFNRFKGGTGIGNFLQMLAAMFDNIISRIGATIAALLGFDDEISKGKVGEAIGTLKDVFVQVGIIIKWLYVNVIRPTLLLLFEGVAACLKDIGDAFKKGDITHIFEVIINAIKTIGSLQIVKLIMTITKLLGSGGLLKVIRNTAKTIKQVGKYFAAKTLNENSKAVLHFAIGIGILTAALIVLANLSDDKFAKVAKMAIVVAGAFTVLLTSMALLTRNSGAANFWDYLKSSPMEQAAKMFWSLTASIVATVLAVILLRRAFEDIWNHDEITGKRTTLNVGALIEMLIGTLTPVIAVLGVLGTIILMIRKAKIVSTLGGIAAVLASTALAVALLAKSINTLTGTFKDADNAGQVWASFAMVFILFAALTAVTVMASKFISFNGTIRSGIALAIGIVSIVASMALFVMPMLEDMVQNAKKFPEYAAAIALFSAMMLSIAGSLALMTLNTKGSASILLAGVSFGLITLILKNFIAPMIKEMQNMNMGSAAAAAFIIGGLALALGKAMQWIFNGFGEIIKYVAEIKASQWLSIILGIGGVIAGIMLLSHFIDEEGRGVNVGTILLITGSIITIILALGVFTRMLGKAALADSSLLTSIVKIFNSLTIFLGVIIGGMIAMLATIKLLFKDKDNMGDAFTIIGVTVIATLAIIAVSLYSLVKAIESMGRSLNAARKIGVENIAHILENFFKMIAVFMGILVIGSVLLAGGFNGQTGYIGTMATMVISALVLIGGVLGELGLFLTKVPNYNYDDNTIDLIKRAYMMIAIIIGEFVASTLLIKMTYGAEENYWAPMAAIATTALATIGGVLLFLGMFLSKFKSVTFDTKDIVLVSVIMISIAAILAIIGAVIVPALEKIKDVPWKTMVAALVGIAAVIGVMALMINGLQLANTQFSMGSIITGMVALIAGMWALSHFLPDIFDAFNKFRGVELMDLLAGLAAIILPFIVLTDTIMKFSAPGVGEMFLKTCAEIALGILAISAALAALAISGSMMKDVLGLGETTFSIFNQGFKKEAGIKSPSKEMAKDAKYIAQGLGLGIKKNMKLVTNASTGMAEVFNEDFCDTLGIESPSKVFYENGRFVVRGFINGMQDETGKNKKAGEDMASGFLDGLNLDNIKDELNSIWDFGSLEDDAAKAGKTMGDGFFDSLYKSLFGEDGDKLTDAEKAAYDELIAKRNKYTDKEIKKWEDKYQGDKQTREFAEARALKLIALQDKWEKKNPNDSAALKALQIKVNKATTASAKSTSGSIGDLLSNIFSGSITDAFNSDKFNEALGGFGEKITSFLGIGGEGNLIDSIKDIFTGENGVVKEVKDAVIEATGGENGAVGQVLGILNGDTDIQNAAQTLGDSIGQGIIMGISNALTFGGGRIQDLLDGLSGKSLDDRIRAANLLRINTFANNIAQDDTEGKYKTFANLMRIAIDQNKDIVLTDENVQELFDRYKKSIDSGFSVARIDLEGKFIDSLTHTLGTYSFSMSNGENSYFNFKDNDIKNFRKTLKNLRWIGSANYTDEQWDGITDEQMMKILNKAIKDEIVTMDKNNEIVTNNTKDSMKKQMVFGEWLKNNIINGGDFTDNIDILNDDIQNLLTKYDFNQEDFNRDEIQLIRDRLDKAGLLNADGSININDSNSYEVSSILQILQDIAQNGLTVKDKSQIFEKSLFDELKGSGITLDYLRNLESESLKGNTDARNELSRITGGRSVDNYLKDVIYGNYSSLLKFMQGTEYNSMNKERQQYYKDMKAWYEKYYSMKYYDIKANPYGDVTRTSKLGTNEREILRKYLTDEQNVNSTIARDLNFETFENWVKKNSLSGSAEQLIAMFELGWKEGWIKLDKDNKIIIDNFTQEMIDELAHRLGIRSPSRVAISLMDYFMQGIDIGIDEGIAAVLSTLTNMTDLMTDTTLTGINGMISAVDDESIQPTITPVLDDTTLQNGVVAMASSFTGLGNTMQATVDSFNNDNSVNYNGSLAYLANQVNNLTGIVNGFMQMVAEGDIVTVNVNAEADTNNLYNFVVDSNRQRFRQTGKNPLAYT